MVAAFVAGLSGCGEDYREARPLETQPSEGQKTTAFKQGCLALYQRDKEDLLLNRLAEIAGQAHPVCRKIAAALESRRALDLSASQEAEKLTYASLIFTLTKLESLSLAGNQLRKIEGIRALTGLLSLDVSGNQELGLADEEGESPHWQVVGRLPLRQLNIAKTQTANLAPLVTLYFLESLDISGNGAIADLTPLARLENLQSLKAEGIALGTTIKASADNCPTTAKSPAVQQFCRNLINEGR